MVLVPFRVTPNRQCGSERWLEPGSWSFTTTVPDHLFIAALNTMLKETVAFPLTVEGIVPLVIATGPRWAHIEIARDQGAVVAVGERPIPSGPQ